MVYAFDYPSIDSAQKVQCFGIHIWAKRRPMTAHLYGLGYPRQPFPWVTLAFSLISLQISTNRYYKKFANQSLEGDD